MSDPLPALKLVALRKESVDRNFYTMQIVIIVVESLSARRAWIEISITVIRTPIGCVALRKESVDRNIVGTVLPSILGGSLSARRAWIEMMRPPPLARTTSRRSPQGERG